VRISRKLSKIENADISETIKDGEIGIPILHSHSFRDIRVHIYQVCGRFVGIKVGFVGGLWALKERGNLSFGSTPRSYLRFFEVLRSYLRFFEVSGGFVDVRWAWQTFFSIGKIVKIFILASKLRSHSFGRFVGVEVGVGRC